MVISNSDQLVSLLAIPFITAFFAAIIRNDNFRDSIIIVFCLLLFVDVINVYNKFSAGVVYSIKFMQFIYQGMALSLTLEPLSMVFILIISFLWLVTSIYSIGYMRANKYAARSRFACFFSLAIGATMGVALAGNLITMFVFYEVLTIFTYPLVVHNGTQEAKKAGREYLLILMASSFMLLLPALVLTSYYTGTLEFTKGGIFLGKDIPGLLVPVLLVLYIYGLAKSAIMPLHRWLPAAMVAPTPVSALLHAVAVVKSGVFCILKVIVYIFGIDQLEMLSRQNWLYAGWLIYVAGFTVVAAGVIALFQDSLKLRLAYSTISQLSYVIMSAAIFVPKAIIAAVLHIVFHAFGKITMFFAAGAIATCSGKTKISELAGIGKKMPWTMVAFSIAALSVIGVPPTAGFISKWYMFTGAFDQELYFVFIIILLGTVLNAGYLMPIIGKAFFVKNVEIKNQDDDHGEAPITMIIALMITAIMSIILFIFPDIFMGLAEKLVSSQNVINTNN